MRLNENLLHSPFLLISNSTRLVKCAISWGNLEISLSLNFTFRSWTSRKKFWNECEKGSEVENKLLKDQNVIPVSSYIKNLTFGSSRILFASRERSSSDRVYLITSSGTDCRLQWLRSIDSTCRLQARKIGMHLNMALIIHYGPFDNMWKSEVIPKDVKNMNNWVVFRDLAGYIIEIRMLKIARDVELSHSAT